MRSQKTKAKQSSICFLSVIKGRICFLFIPSFLLKAYLVAGFKNFKFLLMIKHIFLLSFSLALVTIAGAQAKPKVIVKKTTVQQKVRVDANDTTITAKGGWTAAEQKSFLGSCVKSSNMGEEKGTVYCNCMLAKLMKLYPKASDASAMSQEKMIDLAKECLGTNRRGDSVWTANERTVFLRECTTNAVKSMGPAKTKTYCNCMLGKIEKAFPNPADTGKMTEEELNKWAAECLQ